MKYKCLVLDHDDTMVKSTPFMHYPSFLETLNLLRPGMEISLEQFFEYGFEPGFFEMCTDIIGYNEEEMAKQYEIWHKNIDHKTPDFFEEALKVVTDFKKQGGIVTVVSHSSVAMIKRHYEEKATFIPDMIFGYDSKLMKPDPYPLIEIMKKYNLKPNELVVIDDLKPGYDMAKAMGVDFIWAGWTHQIDKLIAFMKENATVCLMNPKELYKYI
ncbi:MAG: HAD family hydrolase [Clostridiales bacterium]|nr:HAD family hydrolase [Clostridiales bacterium]